MKELGTPWLLLLTLLAFVGCEAERRLHWLDPDAQLPGYTQTEQEMRRLEYFELLKESIDADGDGKVIINELHAAKEHYGLKANDGITFDILRKVLTEPPTLMYPEVFEDMWWLMTHNLEEELNDYTEIWFKHVDINGDGIWDEDEVEDMIISGSRTYLSPTHQTKYHHFLTTLDVDESKGLSHEELWGPVVDIIKSSKERSVPARSVARMYGRLPGSSNDGIDVLLMAKCMDANKDGNMTMDEEIDFIPLLDKNLSDEIEEFELEYINKAFKFCDENPDAVRAKGEETMYNHPAWKNARLHEF